MKYDDDPVLENKVVKEVTFAEKLIVNEDSLDTDMLERIKHNLEYNDDRIFEGLSIFDLKSDEEQACQVKEQQPTETHPGNFKTFT